MTDKRIEHYECPLSVCGICIRHLEQILNICLSSRARRHAIVSSESYQLQLCFELCVLPERSHIVLLIGCNYSFQTKAFVFHRQLYCLDNENNQRVTKQPPLSQ